MYALTLSSLGSNMESLQTYTAQYKPTVFAVGPLEQRAVGNAAPEGIYRDACLSGTAKPLIDHPNRRRLIFCAYAAKHIPWQSVWEQFLLFGSASFLGVNVDSGVIPTPRVSRFKGTLLPFITLVRFISGTIICCCVSTEPLFVNVLSYSPPPLIQIELYPGN